MTDDEEKTHSECKVSNLCKKIVEGVDKVGDHNHLTASSLGKLSANLITPQLENFLYRWDKLNEDSLPMKRDFYSMLTESDITEEYDHAKALTCSKIFRDLCMETYSLNAVHYYTVPGLSFHVIMKFTGKKLDLLTDYDMLLMFENGIRGGLMQASLRYAKANNEKTLDYDEKDKSWLIYQD
ncbi:Hypothetical protein CINCED_3A014519 [Cinara cedri]|uniref:Uncharacterized protein n=1 Tax=Cinara cedri TaxID=506608 RepID=A0A5E4M6P5_9HEMI|nr:Hypothetical protein CINCED_3A014519 [Cinara cedri]